MEFVRTAYSFTVYGEKVELRAPRVKEFNAFEKRMNAKDDKGLSLENEIDLMIEFLTTLGMTKIMAEELEAPHLHEILRAIASGGDEKK